GAPAGFEGSPSPSPNRCASKMPAEDSGQQTAVQEGVNPMRSVRPRLSAAAIAAGLTTMVLGLGAGPAQASLNGDCFSNALDNTGNSLTITTQPAAGSDVPAGTS